MCQFPVTFLLLIQLDTEACTYVMLASLSEYKRNFAVCHSCIRSDFFIKSSFELATKKTSVREVKCWVTQDMRMTAEN